MGKKSVGKNALLNGMKTVVSMIMPLITYPYITRVLQIENIGKYNFSYSVVTYFALLSELGIATYAVREGAQYRDDRKKLSTFASEVFSINIISMIISYLLLAICVFSVNKFHEYALIISILSVLLLSKTIGCEWIFSIYEEYFYITLRGIIVQLLVCIALFTFVKTKNDLLVYVVIMSVSISGANICNVFFLQKYCDMQITLKNLKRHLAPILTIFANNVAIAIFVNSDITILGFYTSDYNVGLYSIAVKIYNIIKQLLAAIIIVAIPRFSIYWRTGKKFEFEQLAEKVFRYLIIVAFPAMVGMMQLSQEIILLIAGKSYIAANASLKILSVALIISLFGWFYSSAILVPCEKEGKVLLATVLSAILNVLLNIILIPFFQENAAAFTTVLAELVTVVICMASASKIIKIKMSRRDILSVFIGCFFIIIVSSFCRCYITNIWVRIGLSVGISVLMYGAILLVFKNDIVLDILKIFMKKRKRY